MVNDNRIMFFSDFLLLFLFCQVLFILTNFFCISAFSNLCSSYLRSSSVVRSSLRMASSDREGLWDMDLSSYLSHKEKDWETRSHIVSQGEGLWEKNVFARSTWSAWEGSQGDRLVPKSKREGEKKEQRVEWGSALPSWPFKRFFPTVQSSVISRTFHYKFSSFSGAFHS